MESVAQVKIPENILLSLRGTIDGIGLEMKRALAVVCYNDRKLSLGQCSDLAEMSELAFIKHISKYSLSIFNFDSTDELLEDIKNA